ncbi:hypothetical protein [Mycolicibacter kumamotonensis]|uniref:Uncharacterized protein n=1 Tax=Mycolicibacter kumamotonensis TaxID=354243 RepID=A0A1B8S8J2_9MYCO|nr:hypothetical protein [Mycolicibacter kumamotonensis]NDJ92012.1 hypothetical protein [Mycolicibacter kumamotonensis]OBY29040.1 hypothetical protein ACT18_25275 [Mycolicibacter kumamotonensis]
MKTLLEYFLMHFDMLYLDPQYHITNSSSRGLPTVDASLQVTGPILSWNLKNNRGQIELTVAPTQLATLENWFWLSLLKQYIDAQPEIDYMSADEEIEWVRNNMERVEQIFTDTSTLDETCKELRDLRQSNSDKYWARWRQQQGLS